MLTFYEVGKAILEGLNWVASQVGTSGIIH